MQINKLARLERKYVACRKRRLDMLEKMRQNELEVKKQLEAERYNTVSRAIKKIGFPIEHIGIIVGAVLLAKKKFDENDTAAVNSYLELYNAFLENEKQTINESDDLSGDVSQDAAVS